MTKIKIELSNKLKNELVNKFWICINAQFLEKISNKSDKMMNKFYFLKFNYVKRKMAKLMKKHD